MMTHPDLTPQRLTELCRTRLDILHKMRDAYLEQSRSLEDSDVLLGTIARKQYLLDQLLEVQDQIAPFQKESPETRQWPSESERQACQKMADDGQAILLELKQMEQQAIEALQDRQQAVQADLYRVENTISMQKAYELHNQEHASYGVSSSSGLSLEG